MGFRFRKSLNLGPLRINFSKSGIGYSVGNKFARVTKKANGGVRTTSTIPGTGITSIAPDSFAGVQMNNVNIFYRTSSPAGYIDNWISDLGLPTDHIHNI